VHFSLSPAVSSGRALPSQQQHQQHAQAQTLELASGGTTHLPALGSGRLLRLWLGGGDPGSAGSGGGGWSQAVLLPRLSHQPDAARASFEAQEPMLLVLFSSPAAAASATAAGVEPPAGSASRQQLGAVLAQLLPPDAATGQASVHFWPPLLLHNKMPCPLRLMLPAAVPGTAAAGAPAAGSPPQQAPPALQEVVLAPGASRQLMVPLQGGTVGALLALQACSTISSSSSSSRNSAHTAGGAADGGSSRSTALASAYERGLAVVVPRLIADSPDQQWFGGRAESGAAPGAAAGAGAAHAAAVYISPPGESTCLHLPLLLTAPGSTDSAGSTAGAGNGAAASGGIRGSGSGNVLMADCVLVTQQHTQGLPLLQLLLLPALAVHNCLPVPLLFKASWVPMCWAGCVAAAHVGAKQPCTSAALVLPPFC
jgi:hypothetical protein